MQIAAGLVLSLILSSVPLSARTKTPAAAGVPRVLGQSPSSPASDAHASAAALLQKGDLDGAEHALWQILNQLPDDVGALRLLGEVRLKQQRLLEAEALLKRSAELDASDPGTYVSLGQVYRALGNSANEEAAYRQALRIAPKSSSAIGALAALLESRKDYAGSLELLRRIPPSARPSEFFVTQMADELGLGNLARARALIPAVLGRHVPSTVTLRCADVFLRYGLPDDALSILRVLRLRAEGGAAYFVLLGRAQVQKGQTAEAEQSFGRSLKLDPSSVEALRAMAIFHGKRGQWEQAFKLLERADQSHPGSPEMLHDLAYAAVQSNHALAAVAALNRLLELKPDDAENRFLLGVALLSAGDEKGSEDAFQKYTQMRPDDPRGYLAIGTLRYKQGAGEPAAEQFQKALQLNPREPQANYYLGLLARNRGDREQAVVYLERGVSIDPKNFSALSVLGAVYLSLGEYDKAKTALLHALELAPDSYEAHYQLALVYQRLGQREQADQEMQVYRKLRGPEMTPRLATENPTPPAQSPPQ